jgi:predicted RNA-binding Zn ribbon-like protein
MTEPLLSAPSRAASLPLVGSKLALDFTNTSSGRGTALHREHFHRAGDIIDWACHAGILTASDGNGLRSVVNDGELAAQLLQRTLALRESIHAVASALAQGRPPSPSDVNDLTGGSSPMYRGAQLVLHNSVFVWTWDPQDAPIESVLGPIGLSALALLTQADLSRVKQCGIAAGCFSTRPRTKAADGAKWKSAGTAPNRSATRQNRKRRPRLERVPLSRYSHSPLPPKQCLAQAAAGVTDRLDRSAQAGRTRFGDRFSGDVFSTI